jgi:competence protein ComEC
MAGPPLQRPLFPILAAWIAGTVAVIPGLGVSAWIASAGFLGWMITSSLRRGNLLVGLVILSVATLAGWRSSAEVGERLNALESARSVTRVPHLPLRATIMELGCLDTNGVRYRAIVGQVAIHRDGESRLLGGLYRIWADRDEQLGHFARLADLAPGSRIAFRGRIRAVEARENFHAYNPEQYALLTNTAGSIAVDWDSVRVLANDGGQSWWPARLVSLMRDQLHRMVERTAPNSSGRLRAFLLNDFSDMARDEIRSLRNAGLFHIYSISGTHFVVFAGGLLLVLRLFLQVRTAWFTIVTILGMYLILLDFPPPAFRAWIMLACIGASWVLRRESDTPSALVLAAFILLLWDPLLLLDRGFLLSFAGTMGLVTVASVWTRALGEEPPHGTRDKTIRYSQLGMFASLGATLCILPLQLLFFQQFHLLAPLANLPAALLAAGALAGGFMGTLLTPLLPPVGLALGSFAAFCLSLMSDLATTLSGLDLLMYRPPAPPLWAVFGAYACLFSGYHMVPISSPEYLRKASASLSLISLLIVSGLVLTCHVPSALNRTLRITLLDIGQGDSTLIEFPDGRTLLLDGGNAATTHGLPILPDEIRSLGYHRRPLLLATHVDADHIGGFLPLVCQIPLQGLMEGNPGSTATLVSELRDAARTNNLPIIPISKGDRFVFSTGLVVEAFHPPAERGALASSGRNQDSVVLHVSYGEFSMLFMGDAPSTVEQQLIDEGLLSPITVLRLGHHGSRTSTSPTLLDTTRPQLAVVSAGRNNTYGHPSTEVLDRLAVREIPVLRTDEGGAIRIETDGKMWRLTRPPTPRSLRTTFVGISKAEY